MHLRTSLPSRHRHGHVESQAGRAGCGHRRREHGDRLRSRSVAAGRCRSDHDHGGRQSQEMPASPEDLHDMLEEGVELMHGRAVTAVLGNGKVEALQLHPARFSGAINASPITVDREAAAERFPVDNVIIAVGQRAASTGCRLNSRTSAARSRSIGSDASAIPTFLPRAISCNSVRVSR